MPWPVQQNLWLSGARILKVSSDRVAAPAPMEEWDGAATLAPPYPLFGQAVSGRFFPGGTPV